MPSKHPLAAPLLPVKRANLNQEYDSSSDDSAESDWEEGRTLVPPEHDESTNAASQKNAYLLSLVDSLAEPFAQKAAGHKRRALAALEPALDFTAAMHAQLAAVADAPFLKGIDAFDASAGRMHGAVVNTHEALTSGPATSTPAELRALLKTLSAQLKARQALLDRWRADVAAHVDVMRAELDAVPDELDALEAAADKKEKALLKQAKEGGVAKRDADRLIKQLLGS